ncbi:MAG: hypothetical protein HY794_01595 [Desulfarculus sp.]|nr:hypothetical protein [Desulfarculus sp.]
MEFVVQIKPDIFWGAISYVAGLTYFSLMLCGYFDDIHSFWISFIVTVVVWAISIAMTIIKRNRPMSDLAWIWLSGLFVFFFVYYFYILNPRFTFAVG